MGKHKFKHIVYVPSKNTRCPVSGKVQHRTGRAAEDHLAYIKKNTVYLCAFCDAYHFGHRREDG